MNRDRIFTDPAGRFRRLEAGAAGFIGKPYRINALLRKVREILGAGR